MTSNHANTGAPLGCLNEHLNYFSENIASSQPILDGDFDSIFGSDFDLVFDPVLLLNNDVATVARPVQPVQSYHAQPAPVSVPSSFAPPAPAPQHESAPTAATIKVVSAPRRVSCDVSSTHVAAPKPVARAPKRKIAPAQVSPTSVTAVFESIPTPAALKSNPRKRSHSMVESSPKPTFVHSSPTAAAPAPVDTSNMTFQEQEDLRRERNRHHAKRSRQRKRNYTTQLEEGVNEMRKENERLFELLGMDSRKAKVDMALEEQRKAARATEKFIVGLKQPRNRVLDNTTLAFLRELWK